MITLIQQLTEVDETIKRLLRSGQDAGNEIDNDTAND
jgi:hypothetical protein